MSTPEIPAMESGRFELPTYSLDVQAVDLGNEVKAMGLELVETENHEPVRGKEAAKIWSEIFPALAGTEAFSVDFFSHIDRVREFCRMHEMEYREAAGRCIVLPTPGAEDLRQLSNASKARPLEFGQGARRRQPIRN